MQHIIQATATKKRQKELLTSIQNEKVYVERQ